MNCSTQVLGAWSGIHAHSELSLLLWLGRLLRLMRSHRSCSPPHWNHWTKAVPRSDFQSKKRRERLFWMGRMARHGGRLWLADALRRSVHGVRCPLLTKLFYSLAESKVFQNISGFETKNHCLLCEWGTFGKTKLYERNAKQNTALGTPFGPLATTHHTAVFTVGPLQGLKSTSVPSPTGDTCSKNWQNT